MAVTIKARCTHGLEPLACGQEKCQRVGMEIQREMNREAKQRKVAAPRRCKLCKRGFTGSNLGSNVPYVPHTHNAAGGVVTKVQPIGATLSAFREEYRHVFALDTSWYIKCFGEENPWSQWLLKQKAA